MQATLQDFTVDFLRCNRQFDWLEMSIVYDKRDKHLTIYDSYNAECAAQLIKSVELANILENYSLTNTKRYNSTNSTQKNFSINSLLRGTVTAARLHRLLTTFTRGYIRNCLPKQNITKQALTNEYT